MAGSANNLLAWCTTRRSIDYRKYILQITQPSQYRYSQLQYRFAVISEAPGNLANILTRRSNKKIHYFLQNELFIKNFLKNMILTLT